MEPREVVGMVAAYRERAAEEEKALGLAATVEAMAAAAVEVALVAVALAVATVELA